MFIITPIKDALAYKLQGTVTGVNTISYPSEWNEAFISVTYTTDTIVIEYAFHIIKKDVENLGSNNYKFYRSGLGNMDLNGYGGACILASTGTFALYSNGTDYLNSATVTMYYR